MYQKILVPLDGSSLAESALPYVEALAATHNAEIVLLQVVVDPIYDLLLTGPKLATATEDHLFSQRAITQRYLDCLASRCTEKGIRARTMISEGIVADKILDCARRVEADLIVLTNHGFNSPSQWKLGNVTYRLLHDSEIPVLLIRSKQPSFKELKPALSVTPVN
ncbi:MAG: universal stress protein [Chloroflexi bacterium]|nr:universal stress protein [Chloroflexota bacterium]